MIIVPKRKLWTPPQRQRGFIINPYRFAAGGGGGPTLISRLRFNGPNGSTTMTDEVTRTWTANGNAQLSTANFDEGTSSLLLDGSGDFVSCPDSGGTGFLNWAADNWLVKTKVYYTSGSYKTIAVKRANGGTRAAFYMRINPSGAVQCGTSNGLTWYEISPSSAISASAWYDIDLMRMGTTLTQKINDSGAGSIALPASIAFESGALNSPVSIGANGDGSDPLGGNIDLFEIWKL